jgi:hypothetical protein
VVSDSVLFPALELGLLGIIVWSLIQQRRWDIENGGLLRIKRGDKSMNTFHGAYALLTGVLVLIPTAAKPAEDHVVLFVTLNAAAVFYLCYLNRWFRNVLVRRLIHIQTLDG